MLALRVKIFNHSTKSVVVTKGLRNIMELTFVHNNRGYLMRLLFSRATWTCLTFDHSKVKIGLYRWSDILKYWPCLTLFVTPEPQIAAKELLKQVILLRDLSRIHLELWSITKENATLGCFAENMGYNLVSLAELLINKIMQLTILLLFKTITILRKWLFTLIQHLKWA